MNIDDYISDLDSVRFGFKVAKFDAEIVNIDALMPFMKINEVKLCICRVTLENIKALNLLEKHGFNIKDVQVTYRYDLDDSVPNLIFNKGLNIIIRDADRDDMVGIEAITRDSFNRYGHYAADIKLPSEKVGDIYCDWARRSIEDRNVADKIILAEIDNEVAGFLSFKIRNKDGLSYASGGLGCVSKKLRNQKIFRLITLAGLKWGKEINLSWIEHNVLVTNYPVNSTFSSLGFRIYKSFVTLHCWI